MTDVLGKFVFGLFFVIGLMIVFVRAGQYGHATGGQQSAQFINALGGAATNFAKGAGGS